MLSSPQCGFGDGSCIILTKGEVCHSPDFVVAGGIVDNLLCVQQKDRSVLMSQWFGASLSVYPPSDA